MKREVREMDIFDRTLTSSGAPELKVKTEIEVLNSAMKKYFLI